MIFYLIFFSVYLSGNYYIFIRGWQALPNIFAVKLIYTILFWVISLSFMISRFTGKQSFFTIHKITTWIGSYWLAAALYFFLVVLLFDIVRLANHFVTFLPLAESPLYLNLKLYAFVFVLLTVIFLLITGNYNARRPVIKNFEISIPKKNEKHPVLKIAMVSDIHLGSLVYEKYLTKLTQTINAEKPDMVLMVGDILDEELSPVIRNDIGKPFRLLNPKLGVWAIPGNHEHIGNFNKAINYIKSLNINLLIDSSVLIDNSFYLIGRNDKDAPRFGNAKRKPLKEIMQGVDTNLPLILMDHQPSNLNDAIDNEIDLQVSGHTHNGQFFPFNLITRKVFELSYGYLQKGKTHFYVSSGFGTWGPPVRIGSKPEIVFINVRFSS